MDIETPNDRWTGNSHKTTRICLQVVWDNQIERPTSFSSFSMPILHEETIQSELFSFSNIKSYTIA